MSSLAQEKAERATRMLAEAAEIMLGAMRAIAAKLEAAETPEATRDLGLALQRVNRGFRQTLLLEATIDHYAREAESARAAAAKAEKKAKDEATLARLRVRARGVILDRCDSREEAEPLLDDLDLWAKDYVAGCEGAPLEEVVIRLCRDVGVEFEDHELPPALREGDPPAEPAAQPPPLVQQPDYGWSAAPNSS